MIPRDYLAEADRSGIWVEYDSHRAEISRLKKELAKAREEVSMIRKTWTAPKDTCGKGDWK
jgi:hypothetical protein